MGKTLFIGCSHSMGYNDFNLNTPTNTWQENNYAEIYSQINNKEVIVMASAGCGNRVFPNFLAYALKNHNDIDEVFVQSTYWGRFPVAINPDLNEQEIFPLDFFIEKEPKMHENVQHYSLGLSQQGKYLEQYLKPEVDDYDKMPYIKDTIPFRSEPDIRRSSKAYIQMWHYNQTHLEQQDYMKDMTFIDMLCNDKQIPVYLWNINNRCFIPKELNGFYTNLKQTNIANTDAISFLGSHLETEKVDSEHYNYHVHKLIAEKYIPYIREIAHDYKL
jgi:hypothetical protein